MSNLGDIDLYEVLGVTPAATSTEIRQAFIKLSVLRHPDKPTGSNQAFQELNHANSTLKDIEKRKKYDKELRDRLRAAGRPVPEFWSLRNEREKPATTKPSTSYGNNPRPNPKEHRYGPYYGGGGESSRQAPRPSRNPSPEPRIRKTYNPKPEPPGRSGRRTETHYGPSYRQPSPSRRRSETRRSETRHQRAQSPPPRPRPPTPPPPPQPAPQQSPATQQTMFYLACVAENELYELLRRTFEMQKKLRLRYFLAEGGTVAHDVWTELSEIQGVFFGFNRFFRDQCAEIKTLRADIVFDYDSGARLESELTSYRRNIGPWNHKIRTLEGMIVHNGDVRALAALMERELRGWQHAEIYQFQANTISWEAWMGY
ncbi:hypothetical protein OQA88_6734 [Cercophora sp. LCS_1]